MFDINILSFNPTYFLWVTKFVDAYYKFTPFVQTNR